MAEKLPLVRVDRQLSGPSVTIGSQTVEPVARARGWLASGGRENGGGAGSVVRVEPTEVIVRGEDGRSHRVAITCPQDLTTQRMALTGMLIALACLLLILFAGIKHGRKDRD